MREKIATPALPSAPAPERLRQRNQEEVAKRKSESGTEGSKHPEGDRRREEAHGCRREEAYEEARSEEA